MLAFLFPFVGQERSSGRNGWDDTGKVEKTFAKKFSVTDIGGRFYLYGLPAAEQHGNDAMGQ